MIHHNLDLSYDIWTQSKIKSLPFIDVSNPIWYLERSDLKSSTIISSALNLIMISMLSLLECITHSSSVSLEDKNITYIVNWIFHVSNFLRSFMISFKYGLILLTYSLIDSFLFISPLLSYSIKLLLQKLPTLAGL